MMNAFDVFAQNDGDVTKSYYDELTKCGQLGEIAVALFRCQKRSARAKDYRSGKWRRAAYDVKSWSMGEVCRLLQRYPDSGFKWGWKADPDVLFGDQPSWVLYVDIPLFGQVSFHNPSRGAGLDYDGGWDGQHRSQDRILDFCDRVMSMAACPPGGQSESIIDARKECL